MADAIKMNTTSLTMMGHSFDTIKVEAMETDSHFNPRYEKNMVPRVAFWVDRHVGFCDGNVTANYFLKN